MQSPSRKMHDHTYAAGQSTSGMKVAMMTWKYLDIENNSPSLAGYQAGSEFVWTMTLSNDSGPLTNACLALADSQHLGMVRARRSGASVWIALGAFGDPECYLGYLPTGDTDIELKFQAPLSDDIGPTTIQVYLFHDDGAEPPMPLMVGKWRSECYFWADCSDCAVWSDDYFLSDTPCETVSAPAFGQETGETGQFSDVEDARQWA